MKIPQEVLDLVHNAKMLPADDVVYRHGSAYSSKHCAATPMRIEQVLVQYGDQLYRSVKNHKYKSGWSPVDLISGHITEAEKISGFKSNRTKNPTVVVESTDPESSQESNEDSIPMPNALKTPSDWDSFLKDEFQKAIDKFKSIGAKDFKFQPKPKIQSDYCNFKIDNLRVSITPRELANPIAVKEFISNWTKVKEAVEDIKDIESPFHSDVWSRVKTIPGLKHQNSKSIAYGVLCDAIADSGRKLTAD